MTPQTIVALASGSGRGGVAVIRASGPGVRFGLETVAGSVPEPRRAVLRSFRDAAGFAIDEGLLLFFPAPGSFTGEDVAEFHVHGGPAVIRAMIDRLVSLPGWRLALAGEFTRRAVENGRLDLTAAEAINDLVMAETAVQRRQALRGLGGALEEQSIRWRNDLLDLAALLEAEIDFPDEGDVPVLLPRVIEMAGPVAASIARALRGAQAGERVRDGAVIVLSGPPNAGKSTLLNAIARRDVAIVSPIAGTTRDAIEVRLDLHGYPVVLVDTAGLHDSDDPLEALGMARTLERIRQADLVLWLAPMGDPLGELPPDAMIIRTKADLMDVANGTDIGTTGADELAVSALTGAGLDRLMSLMTERAQAVMAGGEDALVTRLRHRFELSAAHDHLGRVASASIDSAPELLAEDIRLALRALGRLTGRVDIDEIYDRVFSTFCIGK